MIIDVQGMLRESYTPPHGVLLADHFNVDYGYYGHRPAGSKDWLILFTLQGEGIIKLENEIFNLRSGDVVIYPPKTLHNYAASQMGTWEFMWVHFIPEPHWSGWLQLPTDNGIIRQSFHGDSFTRSHKAFVQLISDYRKSDKHDLELAMISLSEILVLLNQSFSEQSLQGVNERINELLKYMSHNLHKNITLNELSRYIGLSVSRLSHLYKEQTGTTISETLIKLRLQKSVQLLEFTTRLYSRSND
jgi:AraC family transcriptional regulator of arabinose operon